MARTRHQSYQFTAEQQARIRAYYANPKKGHQKRLHLDFGVPPWAVHNFVRRHQIKTPRQPTYREWSEEEITLFDQLLAAGYTDTQVRNRLQTTGFHRSLHAVLLKRYERQVLRDDLATQEWTCAQIAEVMGVSAQTVNSWIQRGWLPGEMITTPSRGRRYSVKATDWRHFLITQQNHWQMQKVKVQGVIIHLLTDIQ